MAWVPDRSVFEALCATVDALSSTVQEQAAHIQRLQADAQMKSGTISKLEVLLVEIEARVESVEKASGGSGGGGGAAAVESPRLPAAAAAGPSGQASAGATAADADVVNASLPPGWSVATSRTTGDEYYVNWASGESTYDLQELLPAGWVTAVSRSTGDTYYHNETTGDSTFHWPGLGEAASDAAAEAATAAGEPQLPAGWEVVVSRSTGQPYYFDTVTEATQYDLPELAAGWTVHVSQSTGDTFFVDEVSGESTYVLPTAPADGSTQDPNPPQSPASPSARAAAASFAQVMAFADTALPCSLHCTPGFGARMQLS